jgi:hypothetical protein
MRYTVFVDEESTMDDLMDEREKALQLAMLANERFGRINSHRGTTNVYTQMANAFQRVSTDRQKNALGIPVRVK